MTTVTRPTISSRWLYRSTVRPNRFEIDPDVIFPLLFNALKSKYGKMARRRHKLPDGWEEIAYGDLRRPTRYLLEVLFQCAKLEVRHTLKVSGIQHGAVMDFRFWGHDGRDERWIKLKGKRPGRVVDGVPLGETAAAQGKEAREHYRALRGYIPN